MLKLTPKPTFKSVVSIPVAGMKNPTDVDIEFKYLDLDGVQEFFGGLSGKTDFENLREIVVGWGRIELPFSDENLEAMLKTYPRASTAIFSVFQREVLPSKEKN